MTDQRANIAWSAEGVPISTRFDDPYFSLADGLEETRHVFLSGNDLPARFRDGFHVAELGFGTGLNFLATVQAWRAAGIPGRLHFTSFEAFPMSDSDRTRALAAYDGLPVDALSGADDVNLTIVEGDARETLPRWDGCADAWFLDGFSPAKNPELWEEPLLAEVARHTAPQGTAATYTAAGFVRRGLEAAGFSVTRVTGYGRKRHMTRAVLA
ncbi:FAD-dependent oxidoreductase [Aliishimia ponticola]|uniref:FAD-dependent oxidoreductase n=1 Tax=Aliishimia ponticola TaxID=2499833 RepID=A0A4S4NAF7_9RHOB|nr:tRNA (5-methylaminomethyl-2-thiouridine)(34)-methyltransferase MnmD [Aliishimia ponticola]THH35417.1 FAD-dependent oxidoreductase [Aliishimia ponticola]